MGNLEGFLTTPAGDEPKFTPPFQPSTEWNGFSGYLQTAPVATLPTYDELLEHFGYDPKEVKIVGTLKTSRWQQREGGEFLQSYKFALGPASTAGISDVLNLINKRKFNAPVATGGADVFNWLAGDLQLGKIDGDGTEGVVTRVLASIDKGVAEFKRLRKSNKIGLVHQAWLGDCGEGNVSQGGRNMWRTELTITEQYRVFRRLALYAIDQFAPLVERIEVDVVNGNHDEAQRQPVSTRYDDGHATEAMIALSDALEMNPQSYGHIKIFVPAKEEAFLTREVGSSIMTHAHGHQWRKGKAFEWWAGQALNLHSAGASQFLLHGHTHEFEVHAKRSRVEICVPTFESESTYWRVTHGDVARTGALIMITNGLEFKDLAIV
jgi:predicted phosphodiesterase